MEHNQTVIISNRESIRIDGIVGVLAFNEDFVSLDSESARINVEGKNLKIIELSKEKGEIHILGTINGVYYTEHRGLKIKKIKNNA